MSDDAALLLRIRDRAAAEELYDRHAARMYALALHVIGRSDDAAAVVEDVFLSLADGSAQYDRQSGSPSAWLLRMARDRSLERQIQSGSAPVSAPSAPTPRGLVEEAFYGGKGVAELAAAHSLPEASVRAMLRTGMAELRSQFATEVRR